uniref:Chlorophyll(Ide) b reductase n=1 Tax=Tetraselmis sp. GSL018 TaxID=582737 RepID=A0A061S1B8_9CHLO
MWDLHKVAFGAALSPVVMLLVRGISSWISRPKPVHAPLKLKVVITGGSRGLGLALAAKFLALGDEVVISSRSGEACAEATANLEKQHPGCRVHSRACDVRNPSEVENLAKFAIASMGRCDVWVNNAGMSQNIKGRIFETDPQEIRDIVDTNLLGAIFGSRAAINRMQQQEGGGKVFLMDGRGSLGEATPLSAAYGATKRAIPQLGRTLAKECRGTGVGVHVASPGMVVTGLLLGGSGRQDRRLVRAINVLAETPDTVAEWMVPRMRGAAGTGGYFRFLTAPGVLWRFATAWRRRDRLLPEPAPPAAKRD